MLCALCRLSAPSMRPLLLGLLVVSVALPGCPALFSPAVADGRHLFLNTLAQLLAFCYSADVGAWRNIGEKFGLSHRQHCGIISKCDHFQSETCGYNQYFYHDNISVTMWKGSLIVIITWICSSSLLCGPFIISFSSLSSCLACSLTVFVTTLIVFSKEKSPNLTVH